MALSSFSVPIKNILGCVITCAMKLLSTFFLVPFCWRIVGISGAREARRHIFYALSRVTVGAPWIGSLFWFVAIPASILAVVISAAVPGGKISFFSLLNIS